MPGRFHQILFVVSLLLACWLGMQAVHELGHVAGAIITGGSVQSVVLFPLTISRTDVSPNPRPAIVVWLGPVVGCLLPMIRSAISIRMNKTASGILEFFAGFCLIANGAYIAIGSFDGVGDCGTMLATGSPQWLLIVFGAVTIPWGLVVWHRVGSISEFVRNPKLVTPQLAYTTTAVLLVCVAVTSLA